MWLSQWRACLPCSRTWTLLPAPLTPGPAHSSGTIKQTQAWVLAPQNRPVDFSSAQLQSENCCTASLVLLGSYSVSSVPDIGDLKTNLQDLENCAKVYRSEWYTAGNFLQNDSAQKGGKRRQAPNHCLSSSVRQNNQETN